MNNSAYATREFTYPALTKIALLVVLPVMLIAVLLSLGENIFLATALAGIFLAIFLYVFFQMTGKIRVEPTGLVLIRPLREEVNLPWQEIASVSSNWTDTSIRVKDAMGGRKIAFTLMLNGFQQLVDEVYQRRSDLFAVNPGQEFGVGGMYWLQVAFFSFLGLLFVYIGLFSNEAENSWMSLIFLGVLGLILVGYIFFRPFKITFEHDRMRIRSIFNTREILRNAVLDTRLTVTGGRNRTLLVRVDYHDPAAGKDKHVNLTGFSCGSPRLYGAIRNWAEITEQNRFSAYREN